MSLLEFMTILIQLAVEGTTLIFDCLHGWVLTVPNTSTGMRNGEWEPDPQHLKCLGDEVTNIFNSSDHMSNSYSSL